MKFTKETPIFVTLVNNMANEGMSAEAISRCLLPVFGLSVTVAQVRKMIAMNKEND